jgi:hypothetical protein
VLTFAVAVSVLTGVFFGIVPALRSTHLDLTPSLKESASSLPLGKGRTGRRIHVGGALVIAQVGLSIVVLVGAGLLVRTLQNLRDINPGFDTRNILPFGIDPTLSVIRTQRLRRPIGTCKTSLPQFPVFFRSVTRPFRF